MDKKFSIKDFGFITDSVVKTKGTKLKEYSVWINMIHRCYNTKNASYKTYGGLGVIICDEWKLFSNFKKWYDENYPNNGKKHHLDKDVLCKKMNIFPKIYSPQTCMFLTDIENSKESVSRRDNTYLNGETNPNAKTKNYYSKNATSRSNFKITCKRLSWNFLHFHEDDFGDTTKSGNKKFLYTEIKNNEKRRFVKNKPLNGIYSKVAHLAKFHEENHTTRGNFKESCVSKNWIFEEFVEIYSGHKNAYNKRFFYIHKDKIEKYTIVPNSDSPEKDGFKIVLKLLSTY